MALKPFAADFKTGMRNALHLFGAPSHVEKRESQTPIPGPVVALKRARPEDRTEGLAISVLSLVTMIDEWDAAVGRAPERGDAIVLETRRYGVTDAVRSEVSGVALFYEIAVAI